MQMQILSLLNHFSENIWKRIAQKLRRTILLHLGLGTFRFHYGRTLKPIMFMRFEFLDMGPKINYPYLWRHKNTPSNPIKHPNYFSKVICLDIPKCGKSKKWKCWKWQKTGAEQSRRYALKILENLVLGFLGTKVERKLILKKKITLTTLPRNPFGSLFDTYSSLGRRWDLKKAGLGKDPFWDQLQDHF